MKLSIIIVSYNTSDLTLQTVKSVEKTLEKNSILKNSIELIIIDNNSSDDTILRLKAFKKKSTIPLKIITNKKNVGFAKANNQGIRQTKKSTVLLLNSDTIISYGALEKMYNCLINQQTKLSNLGIVTAQLQNLDGSFQPQGGGLPTLRSLAVHQLMIDDIPLLGKKFQSTQFTGKNFTSNTSPADFEPIGWIAGTAMMISRKTLDTIGLLDENIFMYGEDMEYCLRAHNHHITVGICNSARITHIQSASSSQENAILGELQGYQYIWSKHKPIREQKWLRTILKMGTIMRIIIFSFVEMDPQKVKIYKHALKIL